MRRRLLLSPAILLLLVVLAACGTARGSLDPRASRDPAWPEIGEAPAMVAFAATVADAGLAQTITGAVRGLSAGTRLTIDFGDDTRTDSVTVWADGTFRTTHTYVGAGRFAVTARSIEGVPAYAETTLAVRPRYVVFIQGMNSESRCPGGSRFADRAPLWIRQEVGEDAAAPPGIYRYFSYSGQFCGRGDGSDGAAADYSQDDTCGGIAGENATRLRALIDGAPGKVTVVAHSMGGLLAAYAIAADPRWAREHIASVVTFDSPLGGIDTVRKTVLGGYSLFEGGCGRGSQSMKDLASGSGVVAVARGAGAIVPFYTLDGSDGESEVFGMAQAVPSDRTHIAAEVMHAAVGEQHSDIWSNRPGANTSMKAVLVACAIVAAGSVCD